MFAARALMIAGLVVTMVACGSAESDTADDPGGATTDPGGATTVPGQEGTVLFDEPWVVEEGVWHIGPAEDAPDFWGKPTSRDAEVTGLLNTEDPRYLLVNGPALYGQYRVRIELHPGRPSIPGWCEDVVEVPFRVEDGPMWMASFESFSDPMSVPAGDYRVRYCVNKLDVAAAETAEDEFDGDDYKLYSGQHLIQLWQAPPAPAQVVRQGSKFAASLTRP